MKIIQSLRFRIIVACILFAIVVNFGFTSIVFFILDTSDDDLFNWHIANETEQLVSTYQHGETLPEKMGNFGSVLLGTDADALQEIANLVSSDRHKQRILRANSLAELEREGPITETAQGYKIHELRTARARFHVVKATDIIQPSDVPQNLYYIIDVSKYDRENEAKFNIIFLILISISVILVLAVLVGLHLTKSVVSPLTKLADKVDKVGVEDYELDRGGYYPDEVGFLSDRINSFLSRIRQFIEREKSFSRDASHELRTPVASSQLAVDLAKTLLEQDKHQNNVTGDKIRELLGRIDRSNKDMSHLIETFLLLGREKKSDQELEEVNLRELCEDSLQKNLYLRKNNDVEMNNLVSINSVLTCPKRNLSVVIDNLIRNAFQHTETGSVTVSGDESQIKIIDTGIGISNAQEYETEKLDGTGIGLTIVEKICNIQGWHFEIANAENGGTIASIDLNK